MTVKCPVCGEAFAKADHVVGRTFTGKGVEGASTGGARAALTADPYADTWVHKACTEEAVKRWLRAGRPRSSPLEWLRANGLNWTGIDRRGSRAVNVLELEPE
jgi:hypothetical protein